MHDPTPNADTREEPGSESLDSTTLPTEAVLTVLRDRLEADQSRLGEVYRFEAEGLSADEIAARLGVTTSSFVWNYRRIIEALLLGAVPDSPSMALATARRFRSLLRDRTLPRDVREYLELKQDELERRAEDPGARSAELQVAELKTHAAEQRNDRGIYVYALPHYLRHPVDSVTGHTLLKVGRSDSDVIQRFQNQTRTTALPEEPILLRIYRTAPDEPTAEVESSFHRVLQSAAHSRSVARTAGREWFLTHTRFLDEIARLHGLAIEVVNEFDVADDG